ncbi:T9SS type B sorting domain-containing protein [Flavobacterium sp. JP2137]|uniref:T9SS type B sorting domain-containing protein n=1 Tax=Flavobacterium sp. JP2137 TaxID=3414510 RepID=UPI003D2FE44D
MKKILILFFVFYSCLFYGQGGGSDVPIIMQNGRVQACAGIFHDTGGFARDYAVGEDITMTICPDTPGGIVKLDFYSFLLTNDGNPVVENRVHDRLRIFDGDTAGAAEVAGSPFTGGTSPGAVSATFANRSGCLTIRFTSNTERTAPGWAARISCSTTCQEIVAKFEGSIPAIDPNIPVDCPEDAGVIRLCVGEEITFIGSALFENSDEGAIYEWDFDNNISAFGKRVTTSFEEAGVYRVRFNVKDRLLCENMSIVGVIVQVSDPARTEFNLAADKPVYCLGEGAVLSSNIVIQGIEHVIVPPVSNPVALPDGVRDPITGEPVAFRSCMDFTEYCESAVIESLDDIARLCINMEHTFLGDLDIRVIAPNGASVYLLQYHSENQLNDSQNLGNPTRGGGNQTYGTGLTYCFDQRPTTTVTLREAPTQAGTGSDTGLTKSPGTYLPVRAPGNSLENLIGAPLNGKWCIEVVDKWGGDYGYFFFWELKFDDKFLPPNLSYTPEVYTEKWLPNPDLVLENGVTKAYPTTVGEHTYTYEVEDNFGCVYTEDITITVKPSIITGTPTNLNKCKEANGKAVFNLTEVQPSISLNPNYSFKYFNSLADAQADRAALNTSLTVDILDSPKQIWVKVYDINDPANTCAVIDSFYVLVRNCTLTLNPLQDLTACADQGVQEAVFDLSVQTPLVFTTPGFTVSYFETFNNASLNTGAILLGNLSTYLGRNGQTIFVRVQSDTQPAEFEITEFKLIVNVNPVVVDIRQIYGCPIEQNGKTLGIYNLGANRVALTGGLPNLSATFYRTQFEAETGDFNAMLPNIFTSDEIQIWVRVQNDLTGCYSILGINLVLADLPNLNSPVTADFCETNDDGIGSFVLSAISSQILGTTVPPDVIITYHVSRANARDNVSPLASPYMNNTPWNQTIYARVSFVRSTCSEIVEVNLRVNRKINVVEPTPFKVCVDNLDREVIYDLTLKQNEILNGSNPSDFRITYHVQEAHAQRGIQPILNPRSFSNLISRTAWVRVENINTGCFAVVKISLQVVLEPQIKTLINDYILCDSNVENGFEVFTLSTIVPGILDGRLGFAVTFHIDEATAQQGGATLPNSYQNIVPFNQTIFARIQSVETGCFVTRAVNLRVVPLPVLNIPSTPVAICNSSASGHGTFNLVLLMEQLQNGIDGLQISFYETQGNAERDVSRIINPHEYNNLNALNPVVWVRGFDPLTNCFTVKPLYLAVIAAPTIPVFLQEIAICGTQGVNDVARFDLTVQTPIILASQASQNNIADLVVSYYLTKEAALIGLDRIPTPSDYTNITNPQEIWVRVENRVTGCSNVGHFTIKVNNALSLFHVREIVMCETTPNSGYQLFDLTQRELQMIGGAPIFGTTFKYYTSYENAVNDVSEIGSRYAYRNVLNPQVIWVAVTAENGCRSFESLTIKVAPLPNVNLSPRPLEVCEGETNTGLGEFNLHLAEEDLSNNNADLVYEYYLNEAQAIVGIEKLDFPEKFFTRSTTVWVKIFNKTNDFPCYVIVPLSLVVNVQPFIQPLRPLMGCEEFTDGVYTFDLSLKHNEILNGRNANDYIIHFYLSENLALAGNTPPMPLIYTNITRDLQIIWVRLENRTTGCFYIAPLTLKVEEKVFAYDIKSPLIYCDDNDAVPVNDGFTRIDLTVNSADIIGVQNIPENLLKVVYFASEQDFINNRPIADPTQFINSSSPQTIIAVVRRIDDTMLCEADVRFEVIVNKRPELLPIEGGFICEDLETKEITPFMIDTRLDSKLYNFIWKFNGTVINGATASYYEAKAPGRYTVSTTDKATDCASFNEITVVITKIAPFSVTIDETAGNRDEIKENGKQTIIVNVADLKSPPGVYEFALDEGVYQNSNVFYDVTAGEHIVWVRDRLTGACAVSKVVSVMNYPKFFTPNGDGHNDTWNIKGLSAQPDAKIYIFDRFGKLLKQVSPSGEGWDGTFGGRPVPSTDYWFTVEYNDLQGNRREFKGHFSLKR